MEILTQASSIHGNGFHVTWFILFCPKCTNVHILTHQTEGIYESLGTASDGSNLVDSDFIQEVIYPQKFRRFEHLPLDIKRIYSQMESVLPVDTNVFAVMAGKILEVICRDRKAKGESLHKQLENLVNRNEIPESIAKVADKLRIFRNTGAHISDNDVTRQDAEIILRFCETILEYIYEVPAMLKALEKSADELYEL